MKEFEAFFLRTRKIKNNNKKDSTIRSLTMIFKIEGCLLQLDVTNLLNFKSSYNIISSLI